MLPPEPRHNASANEAATPWQDAARLLSVLDDAGLGVWSWDLQRGIVHWSSAPAGFSDLRNHSSKLPRIFT